MLRAHSTGGVLWVENVEGEKIDALVDSIAVLLVQRFDPLIAGYYHLRVPDKDGKEDNIGQAIRIAEGFHSDDENRQSWALMLRGLAYSERNDPSNAQASLCAAIDRDPSFMPAWRVLAGMLRGEGDGTKAYDLALRLVHSRPEEPEGYRQLGNLRQDCMAGEEQAEEAKRLFEKAIEIGARRGSNHVDYLSHLDYAKFLYTWYDPGKTRSSSPRGAASSKPDYLEAATDQLKQAQKIAPNEASVSALLATILGYPRLDETREERELRLLVAELEANFALSQDSGDPFLSTVMGELLTDHGVEAHKYRSTDKFTKAKELFANARRSTGHSEGLYEALHARALAGTGDFAAADKVLTPLEQRSTTARKRPYYHLEWVRGEMLYNQGKLHDALVRLKRAESIRTCGPRSNLVHELIGIIERELANQQIARRAEQPTTSAQLPRLDWQHAWWRREGKSVSDPQPACPGWKALAGDEAVPPRVGSGLWQRIFGR